MSGCKAAHTPSSARVLLATSCRIKKKKNPPDTHIESVARMLFCPKDVFLGPRKGLDHWRVYKSHLQNTRFVHFSHGRNTKTEILQWPEICLGNDLGRKEGKGHHRHSFRHNSHGQSWITCSLAVLKPKSGQGKNTRCILWNWEQFPTQEVATKV